MNLKKITAFALTGVMAISLVGCKKTGPKGVVASVNGENIPIEQFYENYAVQRNAIVKMQGEEALKEKGQDNKGTTDQNLRSQTLQNLIDLKIVEQDAKKAGIEISDQQVTDYINKMKQTMGGEEKFQAALKQENITEQYLRDYTRSKLLMAEYTKKKVEELKPTEQQLKDYYEKNKGNFFVAKASHILVKTNEEANNIRKQLKEGADFAALAEKLSLDKASGAKGGELGQFSNGQMVKEFDDAIRNMKVGEISDPVKTQFGYHIIKLEEKKTPEFDAVKATLEQELTKKNFEDYIKKLQKDAKVEKYIDPMDDMKLPEKYQVKEAPAAKDNAEAKDAAASTDAKSANVKKEETKANANAKKAEDSKANGADQSAKKTEQAK